MDINILYVDDDLGLATLAKKAFARRAMEVIHTPDPLQGLERLRQGDIHAIILDHYMDGMTGIDFLRNIESMKISAPVIYVTGSEEASVAVEALKTGAADYVIKSMGGEFWTLLINAVENALANSQLRAAKERADEEIMLGKERAEVLLSEVNHRVANSLALVAALIRLQLSAQTDEICKNLLLETQARISAVASMHRSLYTSDDVRLVDMHLYLERLVRDLHQSMTSAVDIERFRLQFDHVQLASDKAVSVGMILTELLTNAIKYAYPDDTAGTIEISFLVKSDGHALLVVEDDGVGMDCDPNARGTGLGTKIITSMANTLGTGLRYVEKPRGTRAEVLVAL